MTPNRAEADFINEVQNDIPDRLQRNKKGQTSNIGHADLPSRGPRTIAVVPRETDERPFVHPVGVPNRRGSDATAKGRCMAAERVRGHVHHRDARVPGVAPERQEHVVFNDQLRPYYKPTGPAQVTVQGPRHQCWN